MPRIEIDWSKTIIYKLVCNDVNIKDCYVGATTNFNKRKAQHKSKCNNENDRKYSINVYQFIRNNGNWNNWSMIMIEEYKICKNQLESNARERYWIELLEAKLNSQIPTRTMKEYNTINKEKNKIYYQNNKERYKIKYEEQNKKKYTCECGSICSVGNKSHHIKTQKHLNYL